MRPSWLKTMKRFKPEQVYKLMMMLYDYSQNKPVEVDDERIMDLWDQMEPLLESDKVKYSNKVNANRENGKLGGRPKKPTITQENPMGLSKTQNNPHGFEKTQLNPKNLKEIEIEIDIDNDIEIKNDINLSSNLSSGEKSMFERLKQKFLNDGLTQEESIEYSKSLLSMKTLEECELFLNV